MKDELWVKIVEAGLLVIVALSAFEAVTIWSYVFSKG